MKRDDALYDDADEGAGSPLWRRMAVTVLVLAVLLAAAVVVRNFLIGPVKTQPQVQQIALVRPPAPPSPPPKPPEKPPEPPKIKEEVKLEQPKPEPQPEQPKIADDKPAADKPLGVDADGSAGADGFGLVGNRGGRDLLTTGAGSRAIYYSGLLQRHFFEAMTRNRALLKEEFKVTVRVWLGDDGRVQKADIVNGSGKADLDEQIQATLAQMSPLRDVPPATMRPMQLRLTNRS